MESARTSNLRHRPIGIGCQGLADAFLLLGLPFDGEGAKQLNKEIFETMYFAALEVGGWGLRGWGLRGWGCCFVGVHCWVGNAAGRRLNLLSLPR